MSEPKDGARPGRHARLSMRAQLDLVHLGAAVSKELRYCPTPIVYTSAIVGCPRGMDLGSERMGAAHQSRVR
jgi:hypothetical protein